jgi:CBS domain-containing protein
MIVSNDGRSIEGIVSERDLAYGLAAYGDILPRMTVSTLMTRAVATCSAEESIINAMKLMTQLRTRHLPVKEGDQLVRIISIHDRSLSGRQW